MTFASRLACGPLVLAAFGCTEPQSGIFANDWCKIADPQVEVLDDMEDGDAVPCSRKGKWSVDGTAAVTPPAGPIPGAIDLPEARAASFRALRLEGTVDPNVYAKMVLPLQNKDLSASQEIDFWARADAGVGNLQLRVALRTTTTPDGDPFTVDVEITEQWGEQGNPNQINNVALGAFMNTSGQVITPADRASCLAIEFQILGANNPSTAQFGFWIDDVQLKR